MLVNGKKLLATLYASLGVCQDKHVVVSARTNVAVRALLDKFL
jgi:hypothetical protein